MILKEFKNKFEKKLPKKPGVYFFISNNGKNGKKILYIGKATFLRDRVRSYFDENLWRTRGLRIVEMVAQADSIKFQETDSVLEAMILEADLIRRQKPKYNIKEKDDKSFNFVVITKEDFPRVLVERGRNIQFEEGKKFKHVFGPFPHGAQLKEALRIIRKIFPFRGAEKHTRFYKQIGLTPDGTDSTAKKNYAKTIRNLVYFFKGKKSSLIKDLKREMNVAAKDQNFERAAEIRNKIYSIEHINDISLLKSEIEEKIDGEKSFGARIEAYDAAHIQGSSSVGVMTVLENGEAAKSQYRKFIIRNNKKGDDLMSLEEILTRRLKHSEWPAPSIIVIDGGKTHYARAQKVLKATRFAQIPLIAVTKDSRHKPKSFIGPEKILKPHKKEILLANSEAHRFAITFHRKKREKIK